MDQWLAIGTAPAAAFAGELRSSAFGSHVQRCMRVADLRSRS
jgi:hypothetical protein